MLVNFKEELINSKYKNNIILQSILNNIEQALKDIKPETYAIKGKHQIVSNARAQLEQRSNGNQFNLYSNNVQQTMVSNLKSMKSKK